MQYVEAIPMGIGPRGDRRGLESREMLRTTRGKIDRGTENRLPGVTRRIFCSDLP